MNDPNGLIIENVTQELLYSKVTKIKDAIEDTKPTPKRKYVYLKLRIFDDVRKSFLFKLDEFVIRNEIL